MDYCRELDYLEHLHSRMKNDTGKEAVLNGPGGINEHKRRGHGGYSCPDLKIGFRENSGTDSIE